MIYQHSACKPPLLCVIDSWTHHVDHGVSRSRYFVFCVFCVTEYFVTSFLTMGDSSFVAEGNRNEFRITNFLLNLFEFFLQIIWNSTLMCRSSAAIRISGFLLNVSTAADTPMLRWWPSSQRMKPLLFPWSDKIIRIIVSYYVIACLLRTLAAK